MNRYQTTFETWNKIAQLYQEKFMGLDLYDDTYDAFCSLIGKPEPAILEFGCGPGNVTKYLLAKRPDFKIQAIDVAPAMVELAQKNNPTATVTIMDCRKIDLLPGKYDGIICGFTLPYLSEKDTVKLIRDCAASLPAGGIIYLSAIEGAYEKSGYEANSAGDKMYVYYYPETFLQTQLEQHHFEVIQIFRKSYPKGTETATHLIFIARQL